MESTEDKTGTVSNNNVMQCRIAAIEMYKCMCNTLHLYHWFSILSDHRMNTWCYCLCSMLHGTSYGLIS